MSFFQASFICSWRSGLRSATFAWKICFERGYPILPRYLIQLQRVFSCAASLSSCFFICDLERGPAHFWCHWQNVWYGTSKKRAASTMLLNFLPVVRALLATWNALSFVASSSCFLAYLESVPLVRAMRDPVAKDAIAHFSRHRKFSHVFVTSPSSSVNCCLQLDHFGLLSSNFIGVLLV